MKTLLKRMLMSLPILPLGILASCGEDSNFNSFFFADEGKTETVAEILAEADAEYNLGNFGDAQQLAEKAYNKDPNNEEAAVLLGYIYMSLAGVDSFQLASSLIEQSATETAKTKTGTATSSSDCDSSDGAVKALCQLGDILGLTADDSKKLTTDSGSASYRFPKQASEAREAQVKVIELVNKAISYICPFVNTEAKVLIANDSSRSSDDSRHAASACKEGTKSGLLDAKSHYIWAFSHLIEGIAFYAVFTEQLTPLQAEIEGLDTSNPLTFVTELATISTAIDTILPTEAEKASDSMLTAIFNDLDAAALAFGQIPGIPESITSSITEAVAELKEQTKGISTDSIEGGDASAAAMKDQLTTEITSEVQSKITNADGSLTELGQEITASEEEKAEFCTAYSQITTSTLEGVCS